MIEYDIYIARSLRDGGGRAAAGLHAEMVIRYRKKNQKEEQEGLPKENRELKAAK